MKELTKREYREFELTFDFINFYVGSMYWCGLNSIYDLRIDGNRVKNDLIAFVKDLFGNDIKKLNSVFNEHTAEHKKKVIQRLISYCNKNRVQPHQLRHIGFKDVSVYKINVEINE